MADDDIYNLELLSLVAKITQEIDNHVGYNDKSLGEFVIYLHESSNKSFDTFKAKLTEVAPFPDSFIQNVDRLILSMHPKYKKKKKSATTLGKRQKLDDDLTELDRKKRIFPALAMRDKEVPSPVSDDIFLKELGDLVAGKTHSHSTELEPERKRLRRSHTPPPRRHSRSPKRVDEDDHGYRLTDTRSRRRSSPGYERGNRGKQTLDDRPVLYKIYNGKVSGIKEFGAFVTLEGVAGRVEGKSLLDSPNTGN